MKKIICLLIAFISINHSISAQEKDSDLKAFKFTLNKLLRISPAFNECKVYIGYLMFSTSEKGNISKAWFVQQPTASPVITLPINSDVLKCNNVQLPFTSTINHEFSEDIPLKDLLKFIERKKLYNTTLKLPMVITASSNTNFKDTCNGTIDLQSLIYLVDQLSGDKKNIGETLLPPMVFSRIAGKP